MYLFYNSEGKFEWASGADFPIDNLVIESGMNALYLDDNDINNQDIIKNYPNYTMIDNAPVYTPIPDSVKLPFERQSKIQELNIACNQDILSGFSSSAIGEKHEYKFDYEYQGNFDKKLGILSMIPTIQTVDWPTKDAGIITHTREQFLQVCLDGQSWIESNLFRYFRMKAEIEVMENIDEIASVKW